MKPARFIVEALRVSQGGIHFFTAYGKIVYHFFQSGQEEGGG